MTLQTRSRLQKELSKLQADIVRLSHMVEIAIDNAVVGLSASSIGLTRQVINNDPEINTLRYDIENDSLRILATQSPAASDLRNVVAAIHIAVELERMGDHAVGIAKLAEIMMEEGTYETPSQIPKMAKRARKMIKLAIDSYVAQDDELANKMMLRDQKINKGYGKVYVSSMEQMQGQIGESAIKSATFMLWIAHNIERVGDRAVNIAERTVFMVTGELGESATTDVDIEY